MFLSKNSKCIRSSDHNFNMDLLRVMAMGMVLLCHLSGLLHINTSVGSTGVELFFVLSGYLIFESLERTNSMLKYYKKRFIRIIPIYWLTLIIIWVWDLFKYHVIYGQSIISLISYDGYCGPKYLRYFFFLQEFMPSENYALWNNRYALWTMSSFAFFYIVAPMFYKYIKKFSQAIFVLGFLVVFCILLSRFLSQCGGIYGTLGKYPIAMLYKLFFGSCVYYAKKEKKNQFLFVVVLANIWIWLGERLAFECFYSLLVLCAVCFEDTLQRFKGIKNIVNLIAKRSFAIYLTHMVTLDITSTIFVNQSQILKIIVFAIILVILTETVFKLSGIIEKSMRAK